MPRDAIGAWEVRADGSRTPACRARAPRPRPARAHPGVGERLLHVHADMYILYFALAGRSCEVEIFTSTTGTNGLPKDSIGHLFFDDALIDDVPTPFGRPMLLTCPAATTMLRQGQLWRPRRRHPLGGCGGRLGCEGGGSPPPWGRLRAARAQRDMRRLRILPAAHLRVPSCT